MNYKKISLPLLEAAAQTPLLRKNRFDLKSAGRQQFRNLLQDTGKPLNISVDRCRYTARPCRYKHKAHGHCHREDHGKGMHAKRRYYSNEQEALRKFPDIHIDVENKVTTLADRERAGKLSGTMKARFIVHFDMGKVFFIGVYMETWVKVYRKVIENGWLKNHKLWVFWSYCLLKASHKRHKSMVGFQEVPIEPGQFIFGLNKASDETGLTIQNIRTSMDFLKSAGNITIKSTNKFSVISMSNWDLYQGGSSQVNRQTNKQVTNKQQTTNKPLTTNNNDNNGNNEKNGNILVEEALENISIHTWSKKDLKTIIKKYGIQETIEIINRFGVYQKSFIPNGWNTQYRLANRWNKLFENISSFENKRAFDEYMAVIARRNKPRDADTGNPNKAIEMTPEEQEEAY